MGYVLFDMQAYYESEKLDATRVVRTQKRWRGRSLQARGRRSFFFFFGGMLLWHQIKPDIDFKLGRAKFI